MVCQSYICESVYIGDLLRQMERSPRCRDGSGPQIWHEGYGGRYSRYRWDPKSPGIDLVWGFLGSWLETQELRSWGAKLQKQRNVPAPGTFPEPWAPIEEVANDYEKKAHFSTMMKSVTCSLYKLERDGLPAPVGVKIRDAILVFQCTIARRTFRA
jgi:hypothetical protein